MKSFFTLWSGVLLLWCVTVGAAQTPPAPPHFTSEAEVWATLARLTPDRADAVAATLDQAAPWLTPALWYRGLTTAATLGQQDPAAALWLYEITHQIALRLKQPRPLALTAYYRGGTYAALQQLAPAQAAYQASQAYFATVGSVTDQVTVVSDLAAAQFLAGEYVAAQASAAEALRLAEQARARQEPPTGAVHPVAYGEAGAWFTLGVLAARTGSPVRAAEDLRRAVTLYQSLSAANPYYRLYLADAYAAQGRVATDYGQYAVALGYLSQALTLARVASPPERVAGLLNSLGYLSLEQEDYPQATNYFNESLSLYRTLANQSEIARVELNLAVIAQRQGDYAVARDAFRRTAEAAAAAGEGDVRLAAGEGLGVALAGLGEYEAARGVLEEHLGQARQAGNQLREAELLWRLAETFYTTGDDAQTITLAQAALNLAKRLHLAKLAALAATTLGQAHFRHGANEKAEKVWEQGVRLWEELRGAVAGPPEARQLLWEHKTTPYQALAVLCIKENRLWDALQWVERAKGRVLLDILQDARPSLPQNLTPAEQGQVTQLRQAVAVAQDRLRQAPSSWTRPALAEELQQAQRRQAAFEQVLVTRHPSGQRWHTRLPAFDQTTLRTLSAAQSGATTYLNYLVTPEETFLFVLKLPSRNARSELHVVPLALKGAALTAQVQQFHSLLAQRYPALATPARALYEALLQPAAPYLKDATTLGLVPDGVLWELPFQALVSLSNRYLLEDYALFYAPSLTVLTTLQQKSAGSSQPMSLLALGNPLPATPVDPAAPAVLRAAVPGPLPEAEAEVQAIAQLYGPQRSQVLVRRQATEAAFQRLAPAARVLHLATHGLVSRRQPLASYLLLADAPVEGGSDGHLEAREIMGLTLNAELAVLSACDTGTGAVGAGEGLMGLSWAFLVAGCRATLVSQWPVNSGSTAQLMAAFYQNWEVGGANKARAWRQAALAVLRDPRYQHPFYWASFALVGRN